MPTMHSSAVAYGNKVLTSAFPASFCYAACNILHPRRPYRWSVAGHGATADLTIVELSIVRVVSGGELTDAVFELLGTELVTCALYDWYRVGIAEMLPECAYEANYCGIVPGRDDIPGSLIVGLLFRRKHGTSRAGIYHNGDEVSTHTSIKSFHKSLQQQSCRLSWQQLIGAASQDGDRKQATWEMTWMMTRTHNLPVLDLCEVSSPTWQHLLQNLTTLHTARAWNSTVLFCYRDFCSISAFVARYRHHEPQLTLNTSPAFVTRPRSASDMNLDRFSHTNRLTTSLQQNLRCRVLVKLNKISSFQGILPWSHDPSGKSLLERNDMQQER
nr:hypothetical protein CFP56_44305 [Quercus suber]